jgi:hypothetical protein
MVHPVVSRLGFVSTAARNADSLFRSLVQQGVSEGDAAKLLEWYCRQYGPNKRVTAEDLANVAGYAVDRGFLKREHVAAALAWYDTVAAAGGDADVIPALAKSTLAPDAIQARLAEIRAIARSDPDGYERNQALQDEQLLLLSQASGGGAPMAADHAAPSSAPAAPAAPEQPGAAPAGLIEGPT